MSGPPGGRSARPPAAAAIAGLLAVLLALNAEARPADPRIVGYYVSWAAYQQNFKPADIDATRFTHIIYAFANIENGQVTLGDPVVDETNLAAFRQLKSRNEALRLLVAIGGWTGSKHFSDAAVTPASRRRFADSVVAFLRRYGLDGADIDWEYPVSGGQADNVRRPKDRENLTLLLQTLRQALDTAGHADQKRYLLTLAAGAPLAYSADTELGKIAPSVDWIGLMAYDFSGPWSKASGHNAPLFADPTNPAPNAADQTVAAAVARTLAAGVPSRKLLLGLPLFGHAWGGCNSRNNGEYQDCAGPAKGTWENGVLDYRDIARRYLTNPAFVRHFNRAAQVPFLFDRASGQFITYDDADSFRCKAAFLRENHLGGAMFWEMAADRDGGLIDLVAKKLRKQAEP